jgi:hypothetical protein
VLSPRVFAINTAPTDIRVQRRSLHHQGRKAGFYLRDVVAGFGKLETELANVFECPESSIFRFKPNSRALGLLPVDLGD